jgi:hypothetical protein
LLQDHDIPEILAFPGALAFPPQLSSISLRNLGPKGVTEQMGALFILVDALSRALACDVRLAAAL